VGKTEADAEEVFTRLTKAGVDFVIIGGIAAIWHGSERSTQDIDLVYSREAANLERLAQAIGPLKPRPRDYPDGLPFIWDAQTLLNGCNFTLKTTAGALDLLGEIDDRYDFMSLVPHAQEATFGEARLRIVSLDKLIEMKRYANREKDLLAIAELEEIRARQEQNLKKDNP
jgi:predicted nucleotidyltransferase